MTLPILYEDGEALVIDKPSGMAVDRPRKGGICLEDHLEPLKLGFQRAPVAVHRLDTDTSGCLLLARNPKALARFNRAFEERLVGKTYLAILAGHPQGTSGTIELALSKISSAEKGWRMIAAKKGKPAVSHWELVAELGPHSLIRFRPETGRTHQLRVHMAAIGHPIVGNGKYGGAAAFLTGGISRKMHLHARRLIITEPKAGEGSGGKLDVTAELPPHFAASMEVLGFDPAMSDAAPLREEVPEKTAEEKKQAARRHFKQARKETRAPRRARGAANAKAKPKGKAKSKPGPGAKPAPKPRGAGRKPTR